MLNYSNKTVHYYYDWVMFSQSQNKGRRIVWKFEVRHTTGRQKYCVEIITVNIKFIIFCIVDLLLNN